MTNSSHADGARARVGVLDFIDAYERLSQAVLRLEQVQRLHAAEAGRAVASGTGSPRTVADAWTSATALSAQAVADLRAAEAVLAAQVRAIAAALPD
jgi:hypothetical protein